MFAHTSISIIAAKYVHQETEDLVVSLSHTLYISIFLGPLQDLDLRGLSDIG